MSQTLMQEIFASATFSDNQAACIAGILGDLQKFLTPIAKAVGSRKQMDTILELSKNVSFAREIYTAIRKTKLPNKGAIAPLLRAELEPLARQLNHTKFGDQIRALYEKEDATEVPVDPLLSGTGVI